jgi:hypothetical protein
MPLAVDDGCMVLAAMTGQTADLAEFIDESGYIRTVIDKNGNIGSIAQDAGYNLPLVFVSETDSDNNDLNPDAGFRLRKAQGLSDHLLEIGTGNTDPTFIAKAWMDNNGLLYQGARGSIASPAGTAYVVNNSIIYMGEHYIEFDAMAAPTPPGAGKARLYAVDDGGLTKLYYKRDDYATPILVGAGDGGKSAGAEVTVDKDFIGTASNTLQTAEYVPADTDQVIEADNQILVFEEYEIRSGASLEIEAGGQLVVLT